MFAIGSSSRRRGQWDGGIAAVPFSPYGSPYGTSEGDASIASSSACCGNHAPAAGSTTPRSGSTVPAEPSRVHEPSDSPGVLIQTYASTSALPVLVVGPMPAPRAGGLHQSCATPAFAYPAAAQFQGPSPLRLVSTTKCVVGCTLPSICAQRESIPTVFHRRSAGLPLYGCSRHTW